MTNFRERLYNGETVVGTFIFYNEPQIAESLGLANLDFVILDMEHGTLNLESVMNMVIAAKYRGLSAIIRAGKNDNLDILRALDIGSDGVQVPLINTKEDALKLVSASKYPPLGNRGVAIPRSADFGIKKNLIEFYEQTNKDILVIAHCETKQSFENLDEILETEEIDVIFLGPFDMSASLGIPQQYDHPEMVRIIDELPKRVIKSGKIPGIYVGTIEDAHKRIAQGYKYIVYGLIETEIYKLYKSVVDAIKEK